MDLWRKFGIFLMGGCAYVGLEVLFRGRSHGTMFLAGGSSLLLLGPMRKLTVPVRGILGAGVITGVELATGLLANRDHRIWDYRHLPLNYRGQICLPFSLLWVPVSLAATELYRWMDK